jgi:hypothetical protein
VVVGAVARVAFKNQGSAGRGRKKANPEALMLIKLPVYV